MSKSRHRKRRVQKATTSAITKYQNGVSRAAASAVGSNKKYVTHTALAAPNRPHSDANAIKFPLAKTKSHSFQTKRRMPEEPIGPALKAAACLILIMGVVAIGIIQVAKTGDAPILTTGAIGVLVDRVVTSVFR